MSATSERIDNCLASGLGPALKASGFKKDKRTWRRSFGPDGALQVVNAQGSPWTDNGSAKVTLNLGVYFPRVVPFLRWARVTERPTESDCLVSVRIGMLMPVHRDTWWTLNGSDADRGVADEVLAAWREFGEPFLDQNSTLASARDYLASMGHTATWAIATSLAMADRVWAQRHLRQAVATADNPAALLEWAQTLGL